MNLREVLQKIDKNQEAVLLSDRETDWEAGVLLDRLSETMLNMKVFIQPGLYIAEINEAGFLGTVLFRLKNKG